MAGREQVGEPGCVRRETEARRVREERRGKRERAGWRSPDEPPYLWNASESKAKPSSVMGVRIGAGTTHFIRPMAARGATGQGRTDAASASDSGSNMEGEPIVGDGNLARETHRAHTMLPRDVTGSYATEPPTHMPTSNITADGAETTPSGGRASRRECHLQAAASPQHHTQLLMASRRARATGLLRLPCLPML